MPAIIGVSMCFLISDMFRIEIAEVPEISIVEENVVALYFHVLNMFPVQISVPEIIEESVACHFHVA